MIILIIICFTVLCKHFLLVLTIEFHKCASIYLVSVSPHDAGLGAGVVLSSAHQDSKYFQQNLLRGLLRHDLRHQCPDIL